VSFGIPRSGPTSPAASARTFTSPSDPFRTVAVASMRSPRSPSATRSSAPSRCGSSASVSFAAPAKLSDGGSSSAARSRTVAHTRVAPAVTPPIAPAGTRATRSTEGASAAPAMRTPDVGKSFARPGIVRATYGPSAVRSSGRPASSR
jgi:hypothetical protein